MGSRHGQAIQMDSLGAAEGWGRRPSGLYRLHFSQHAEDGLRLGADLSVPGQCRLDGQKALDGHHSDSLCPGHYGS